MTGAKKDQQYMESERRFHEDPATQALRKETIQRAGLEKMKNPTVLVLECGQGYLARDIAQELSKTKVIGVDSSRRMIEHCNRIQEDSPLSNIEFHWWDRRETQDLKTILGKGDKVDTVFLFFPHIGPEHSPMMLMQYMGMTIQYARLFAPAMRLFGMNAPPELPQKYLQEVQHGEIFTAVTRDFLIPLAMISQALNYLKKDGKIIFVMPQHTFESTEEREEELRKAIWSSSLLSNSTIEVHSEENEDVTAAMFRGVKEPNYVKLKIRTHIIKGSGKSEEREQFQKNWRNDIEFLFENMEESGKYAIDRKGAKVKFLLQAWGEERELNEFYDLQRALGLYDIIEKQAKELIDKHNPQPDKDNKSRGTYSTGEESIKVDIGDKIRLTFPEGWENAKVKLTLLNDKKKKVTKTIQLNEEGKALIKREVAIGVEIRIHSNAIGRGENGAIPITVATRIG